MSLGDLLIAEMYAKVEANRIERRCRMPDEQTKAIAAADAVHMRLRHWLDTGKMGHGRNFDIWKTVEAEVKAYEEARTELDLPSPLFVA